MGDFAEREPLAQDLQGDSNVIVAYPAPMRDQEAISRAIDAGWRQVEAEAISNHEYMSNAQRYIWLDDYGDVGPIVPELEEALFKLDNRVKAGEGLGEWVLFNTIMSIPNLNRLKEIKVIVEASDPPKPVKSFDDAGLHPIVLSNVKKAGYDIPLPIQCYSLPVVHSGRDLIAISQTGMSEIFESIFPNHLTGSGKTAAYLIPTISKLMGKAKKLQAPRPNYARPDYDHRSERVRAEPLIVIVVPTREIAIQVFDEARMLTYRSMMRPVAVYGGGPMRQQREDLEKGCDILIATPGRLIDFLRDPNLITFQRVRFTIIDEADEMMGADWQEELRMILSGGDANLDGQHQFLLFSATFNKDMRKVAREYLDTDYVRIRIGRIGSTLRSITQKVVYVEANMKQQAVYDLLISSVPVRTLIFCRGKPQADILDDYLFNKGLPSNVIHSGRLQAERERAIQDFKEGASPILIATGVGSRGLDIPGIFHVINYDLPQAEYGGSDEYIHRIGRTGRLGNQGLATSFYNDRDEPMAPFLAKILTENGQEVPDFLEEYKPAEGAVIDFEDESDNGEEEDGTTDGHANGNTNGEAAWGSDDTVAPIVHAVADWTVNDSAVTQREDNW